MDNNGGITNAAGVSSIASSTIGAFRRSMEDCSPIGLIIGKYHHCLTACIQLTYLV